MSQDTSRTSHPPAQSGSAGLAQNLWTRYGSSPGAYSPSPTVELVNRLSLDRLPLLSSLQRRQASDGFATPPELVDAVPAPSADPINPARQALQRQPAVPNAHPVQRLAASTFGAAGIEVGLNALPPSRDLSASASAAPLTRPSPEESRGLKLAPAPLVAILQRQSRMISPGPARPVNEHPVSVENVKTAASKRSETEPPASSFAQPVETPIQRTAGEKQAESAVTRPEVLKPLTVTPLPVPVALSHTSSAIGTGNLGLQAPIQRRPLHEPPNSPPADMPLPGPIVSSPAAESGNLGLQPAIQRRSLQRQAQPAAELPVVQAKNEKGFESLPQAAQLAKFLQTKEPAPFILPSAGTPGRGTIQRQTKTPLPSENGNPGPGLPLAAGFVIQPKENPQSLQMPLAGQTSRAPVPPAPRPGLPLVMRAPAVIQTYPAEDSGVGSEAAQAAPAEQAPGRAETGIDMELLVNKVWQQLMRRLAVESERKGGRRWPWKN